MKKLLASLSLLVTMGIAGVAMAVPYSWTDVVRMEGPGMLFEKGNRYTYTHDITDGPNGFVPLTLKNIESPFDLLTDYSLIIGLDNITRTGMTRANILVSSAFGLPTKFKYDFENDDKNYNSILGWLTLELTGKLNVTIEDKKGEFYFEDSVLTARGLDNTPAPVPEPGTMVLLGAGMLGLAIYGKRRMNNKEA